MRAITNFVETAEALERFYISRPKELVYTLDRIKELLDFVGNPQEKMRVIHVAGTSGKTSTTYYIAALLRANGDTVGMTVSPHVAQINERVQINGQPLDEKMFCAELAHFLQLVEESTLEPTYFELMMAFAFWEFERQKVTYAVVEVGLGGLLDASNTVRRADKICVLTDIGLDHMHVLGKTLPAIATQKAGIIQWHNTVFCYRQIPEVMTVFQQQCRQKEADLHILDDSAQAGTREKLPRFQQRNFGLAQAVVTHILEKQDKRLAAKAITTAASIVIPGRMEVVRIGDKIVILDGAHNEQKLQALFASIAAQYPQEPLAVLVAFGEQPEALARIQGGLHVIKKYTRHLIATEFHGKQDMPRRGMEASLIAAIAKTLGITEAKSIVDPAEAFKVLLARPESVLVIAGSFYLLNHIRPLALRLETK